MNINFADLTDAQFNILDNSTVVHQIERDGFRYVKFTNETLGLVTPEFPLVDSNAFDEQFIMLLIEFYGELGEKLFEYYYMSVRLENPP